MPVLSRPSLRGLALAAALGVAPAASALELRLDAPQLAPDERKAAQRVLDTTLAHLPGPMRDRIGRPVRVHWRDDLPPGVHGRAFDGHVLLRRGLLRPGPPAAGGASGDPAVRALVHELAHVLDRTTARSLSRDARLLDLAGWQPRALGGRARSSSMGDRSPDPYERTSPVEFVAVNLEHFLLDPAYACRRPALYRAFVQRVGMPTHAVDCPPGQVLVRMDADAGAESPVLELDATRIAAVDYLLAEPGTQAMSRWGHGMLRLVVCAPGRARGPDCRLDLAHHVVLSFRAFVDDVQVSGWRGLTGAYPSRLFVLPMSQVIDEYTRVELRGLRSVPLALTPDETASLLERAAQLHWSHDGRYRFLTNNCAVETWRLLRDAAPRVDAPRLARLTPTGLLAALERAGVADTSVLRDDAAARRNGYRFESADTHFQALLDVAGAGLGLPGRDVREWLELPPDARAPWIERAGDLRVAAALLVLENAALRREEHRAREALRHRRLRADGTAGPAVRSEADAALASAARLSRPALLLPGPGYGLPQASELDVLRTEAGRVAAEWRAQGTRLRTRAMQWLPPGQAARLAATERNVQRLGERLRTLHAAGTNRSDEAAGVPGQSSSSSPASSKPDGSGSAAASAGSSRV